MSVSTQAELCIGAAEHAGHPMDCITLPSALQIWVRHTEEEEEERRQSKGLSLPTQPTEMLREALTPTGLGREECELSRQVNTVYMKCQHLLQSCASSSTSSIVYTWLCGPKAYNLKRQ